MTPGRRTALAAVLDPGLVWVPGDVVAGTLYARNVSGENASAVATVHLGGGLESGVTTLPLRVSRWSARHDH